MEFHSNIHHCISSFYNWIFFWIFYFISKFSFCGNHCSSTTGNMILLKSTGFFYTTSQFEFTLPPIHYLCFLEYYGSLSLWFLSVTVVKTATTNSITESGTYTEWVQKLVMWAKKQLPICINDFLSTTISPPQIIKHLEELIFSEN